MPKGITSFRPLSLPVSTVTNNSALDLSISRWDNPIMTLTADSRGRLASLELFPPGTSFEPEVDGTRIILKRLVPEDPKRVMGKLVRRNGRLTLDFGVEITGEAIAKAVPDERDLVARLRP
jgi:hypothetical protein